MSLIQVEYLNQRYGSKTTLRGVSFSLEKGEVFGLIGPTGAGKTTLLRLLDQIEIPSSGRIYFEGQDVTGSGRLRSAVRRKIGMVLQKPVVFNTSVLDNVAYPLKVRGHDRKTVAERVNEMLKTVGLEEYAKRNARTLSGGETQKVALARALVTRPQVLLLDEPTANLDPLSLDMIEKLVLQFNREYGMAVVIATHEMAQGQRLADRIGVMMDGELVQTGKPSEIFSTPSDLRVARFVGVENILQGKVNSNREGLVQIDVQGRDVEAIANRYPGDEVHLCIRPEDITLSLRGASTSARNSFSGQVTGLALSGALARVHLDCGFALVALITKQSAEELGLQIGKQAHVSFKATAVHVIGL
jgi:tungstate transport system ATP-binding protein